MTDRKTLREVAAANPSLVILLAIGPVIGATADVRAALAVGIIMLATILVTCLLMSVLKNLIPAKAVLPAAFLITAGTVTVFELLFHALFPTVYQLTGVYISALSVNLLLFGVVADNRSQPFEKAVGESLLFALQLLAVLLTLAVIREVLGNASFAGMEIDALKDYKIPLLTQTAGGFLVAALLAAVFNAAGEKGASAVSFSDWFSSQFSNTMKQEETES